MATQATTSDFYKTSSTPGTAVALGASSVKFHKLTLRGYKAAGTANTGTVKVRPAGGMGWMEIPTETERDFEAPAGSYLTAAQFEIDVATSGDGVHAVYASAVVYEGV